MPYIPVGINTYAGEVGLITQYTFKIFLFQLFPLIDLMFYKKGYFVLRRGFSDAMEKQAFLGFIINFIIIWALIHFGFIF